MKRLRYLVCYDIRDDRRLRKVAKTVESYGERVQYSVFVSDLNLAERRELQALLQDLIKPEDSIMFVPLGDGYSTDGFEFLGSRPEFPEHGPTIV